MQRESVNGTIYCNKMMTSTFILMNLDCVYVTLVLLGLEDDATRLLLGDQSQRFRYLCMSGLHKIWSKVSRYTHWIKAEILRDIKSTPT